MTDTVHEMTYVRTFANGADEYRCPICGRQIVLRWPPSYDKLVLAAGDETAIHSGSKGGVEIRQAVEPEPDKLEPFAAWAESADLDGRLGARQ